MSSASENFPANRWRMGYQGLATRRSTAGAFRRLGRANADAVTVARSEFFTASGDPPAGAIIPIAMYLKRRRRVG
jgi:hypothetical protein